MCDVDVEAFVETVFRNLDSPDPVMRMFAIHGKKYIDSLLTPSLFEQMRSHSLSFIRSIVLSQLSHNIHYVK